MFFENLKILLFLIINLGLTFLISKLLFYFLKQSRKKIIQNLLAGNSTLLILILGLLQIFLINSLFRNFLGENSFWFRFLSIVLIMALAKLVSNLIKIFLWDELSRKNSHINGKSILSNSSTIVVFLVGLIIIFQVLGIEITGVITALGVGGLAVALALQDTLANFFSGLYILMTRTIKVGDYITIDTNFSGYISDISWKNTQIRELGGANTIIVPNTKISNSIIKNYSFPTEEYFFTISFYVDQKIDFKLLKENIYNSFQRCFSNSDLFPESFLKPFITFDLDKSGLLIKITLKAKNYSSHSEVRSIFLEELLSNFNQHSIFITKVL